LLSLCRFLISGFHSFTFRHIQGVEISLLNIKMEDAFKAVSGKEFQSFAARIRNVWLVEM